MSVKPGSRVWYLKSANGFTPCLDKTYFFEKTTLFPQSPYKYYVLLRGVAIRQDVLDVFIREDTIVILLQKCLQRRWFSAFTCRSVRDDS